MLLQKEALRKKLLVLKGRKIKRGNPLRKISKAKNQLKIPLHWEVKNIFI